MGHTVEEMKNSFMNFLRSIIQNGLIIEKQPPQGFWDNICDIGIYRW